MVHVEPIWIDDVAFTFVHVELPKTDLLVVSNDIGYIMCGALDVDLLNEKLADRHIVAGRAVGVRSLDELLYAPLQKVTDYSKEKYGWHEGMIGMNALLRLK
ncbi:YunC family protein [Aquisalibacillus elongatus]|uniref:Uncharacterized protein YunC (DUF1805 family) n=1 Tax=Aquisalibacillus elongatus TaxID=485577 RepID=A0A3N5B471_9BACI|nr:DUF1805 domain-containing protein [Aquisalibacillus elongatus]RPF50340.1 uncharacterized protein YunC (DUF1805 family) [Aquisalibacillus elongatus]